MVWKYYLVPQHSSKWRRHLFFSGEQKFAICGVGIQWYDPQEWRTDKEGLAERIECRRCVSIIKRHNAV